MFVCSLNKYLSGAFVASTTDVVDDGDDVADVTAGDALSVAVGEALGLGFTPNGGTDIADGGICPIIGAEEPTPFVLPVPPEQPATRIKEAKERARMRVCKKDLEQAEADIIYIGARAVANKIFTYRVARLTPSRNFNYRKHISPDNQRSHLLATLRL